MDSGELSGFIERCNRLVVVLACIGGLAGCAGSAQTGPAPANAQSEPEPANPPADPAALQEDQAAIDRAATTSERLADQTSAQTPIARDRAAVPAGLPSSTAQAEGATPPATSLPPADSADKHAADNTAHNKRDQSGETLTPIDQSNDSNDVKLAAAVRRAVVGADGLSFTAKNVKIIAADGRVTLRGPVKSQAEKTRVEQVARQAAGSASVVSQLEIEQ
ncbi:MAG TPA: BON domain-containing protein [Polyangiales bacterium]|nr:BON domain-containing protein [Polyangiales bacterium]